VSLTDQPRRVQSHRETEFVDVSLRFGNARVQIRFPGQAAADALMPALSPRLAEPLGPADATITVRDRESPTWWERGAPLRLALASVLASDRRRVVHASAVGDDRGGLLLVGPRQSGKTTVAMAALRSGLGFVADDYLLLDASGPFEAVSLYGTACVRTEASDDAKHVVDVEALFPGALRKSLPVRGVVLPRIVSGRTAWRPASPAAALRAWAPTTVFQMAGEEGRAMPLLAEVVRRVPCFGLDVGDAPASLAGAVNELLDRAGSS
jgi:hypothetical protein